MAETWYDTRVGELLIGEAAVAPRLEEGGPDIVPLHDLLTRPNFAYQNGEFARAQVDNMTRDDYVQLGKWVVNVLEEGTPDTQPLPSLDEDLLQRLYILGLGPERQRYVRCDRFDNLADFRDAVGVPGRQAWGKYRRWPFAQFVRHAQEVAAAKGGKPSSDDYDTLAKAGKGPSAETMWAHAGSLDDLHELIGFPNVRAMSDSDLIEWGVQAVLVNGEDKFGWLLLDILSRRDRGPSYNFTRQRFGSWKVYKDTVLQTLKSKNDYYDNQLAAGNLPASFNALPPAKLHATAARYLVAISCAPQLPPSRLEQLAFTASKTFTPALIKATDSASVTGGIVETTALGLHVFDDIWPRHNYLEHLKVDDAELEVTRRKYTDKRQQHRRKAQQAA